MVAASAGPEAEALKLRRVRLGTRCLGPGTRLYVDRGEAGQPWAELLVLAGSEEGAWAVLDPE